MFSFYYTFITCIFVVVFWANRTPFFAVPRFSESFIFYCFIL